MSMDFQIEAVAAAYRTGVTPGEVVDEVFGRIAAGPPEAWITLRPSAEVRAEAVRLQERWPDPGSRPPLYGIPFGVKDNVDVAGLPTTAACPDYAYCPEHSAPLVERLQSTGALLIGKTNLDQFATGLVGTRTPYGVCTSPFHPDYISGGSSAGSAVAVAAGLVSFAVATDTAGSGRVPAGLCNVVGFKPSRGLVSTDGIVPACRSLDCATVMALSVADAARVLAVMAGPESGRPLPPPEPGRCPPGLRIGVPEQREFGGDSAAEALFDLALKRLAEWDATVVPVDLEPFLATGRLLYGGPWVAERWAEFSSFVEENSDRVHPVTRQVLRTGAAVTAADVFTGQRRLAELAAECAPVWQQIDTLLVPTVPTTFTVAEVAADPVTRNAFLGYYTHFVNLLDLAGVAVPNGFTPAGLPHGVTFLAPAGGDALLAAVAERFQQEAGLPAGATERPLLRTPARRSAPVPEVRDRMVLLAVAGTHRTGQPLHPRLAALGSAVVGTVHTAPTYRLYALPDDGLGPARPGLVRAAGEIDAGAGGSGGIGSGGIGSGVGGSDGIGSGVGGSDGIGSGAGGAGGIGSGAGGAGAGGAVEVELHRIPVARLGELLTEIPPPLGLGTVALADGSEVLGFLCEPYATVTALDITGYGSWPAYLAAVGSDPAGSAA